jgi:beta-N-acetylhexosaminidase
MLSRLGLVGALIMALSAIGAPRAAHAQEESDAALRLLEMMTPEERVGQLFLITVQGAAPGEGDPYVELIRQYHISGVILRAENDNFGGAEALPAQVQALVTALQRAALEESQGAGEPLDGEGRPIYLPLLIAVRQDGGGAPYSSILSGLSETPSAMAIGATWKPELAFQVGQVVGRELAALGINVILGPSLDVLEDPRIVGPGGLGVASFGGDPYWVALMGEAYIRGLHEGAQGRLGVIAKHFPGLGGADRPAAEEVATIRKSIEQLRQIELVPFFRVTKGAPGNDPSIADGLLTANIRYQGFQGNIRATTRPVSLDRDAFEELLRLEALSSWRSGGGVTMSDALGSLAIRRFVGSLGQTYKAHLVARDAFLAGNDLLFMADVQSDGDPDELTSIVATLEFFIQKYQEDQVFAQRVDEAVLRILRLKMRIFGEGFSAGRVFPRAEDLDGLGEGEAISVEVARVAATLISPAQMDLAEAVGAPDIRQRILFLSDARPVHQCSTCQVKAAIPVGALENAVLRLYGPRAAAQVGGWNITSYSLADLANYLGAPAQGAAIPAVVDPQTFEADLLAADWIVFSTLRHEPGVYGSDALKLFLNERPDLVRGKKVVVFAHDVPYELDATDISKLDLYYGLYARTDAFVEHAARLLFQEARAEGHSPVSIPGIGYDLIEVLRPDPEQVIGLRVVREDEGESDGPQTYLTGEIVSLQTGIILDHNGNPVPDGTPVEFILSYQTEELLPARFVTITQSGAARIALTLDRPGVLSVRVEAPPARLSDQIQINVIGEVGTFPTPELPPTPPGPTPEPSPEPTQTPLPEGAAQGEGARPMPIGLGGLVLGLAGVGIVAGSAFVVAGRTRLLRGLRVRWALLGMIGGLLGYDYLALRLPGSEPLWNGLGIAAGAIMAVITGTLLLGLATLREARRWRGK